MTPRPPLNAEIRGRARTLRHSATPAEAVLWSLLRHRAVKGVKLRRQHPLGGFILDFYSVEAKLSIELDGNQHLEADVAMQDADHSRILSEQYGVHELRFQMSRFSGMLTL